MGLFGKPNEPQRLTHDEWWAHLDAPGRKLTLDELAVLELMYAHRWLERLGAGLGVHPQMNGGYLEQVRNLIETVFRRARAGKRPDGGDARALAPGAPAGGPEAE